MLQKPLPSPPLSSPLLPSLPPSLSQEWLSGATSCPSISAAVEASVLKENEVVLRAAVRGELQPLRDHLQDYGMCGWVYLHSACSHIVLHVRMYIHLYTHTYTGCEMKSYLMKLCVMLAWC